MSTSWDFNERLGFDLRRRARALRGFKVHIVLNLKRLLKVKSEKVKCHLKLSIAIKLLRIKYTKLIQSSVARDFISSAILNFK